MFLPRSLPRRTAPDTLGAIVLLAAILASAFATSPAHGKTRASKGSHAAKVHVCESVDAYEGEVSPVHPSTRLANACRDMSAKAAQKAIEACAAEGDPAVCEVLFTSDRTTVLIEHKITIPADDLAIVSEGGAK